MIGRLANMDAATGHIRPVIGRPANMDVATGYNGPVIGQGGPPSAIKGANRRHFPHSLL